MHLRNHICLLLSMTAVLSTGAQTPATLPPAYVPAYLVNYVRTWDVRYPNADANTLLTTGVAQTFLTAQYFDGLGRLVQTVERQKVAFDPYNLVGKMDMVTAKVYDNMGRETFQYLPFFANTSQPPVADGSFKRNPFQLQGPCYNLYLLGQNEEIINTNTNWAYAKNNFEPSPLNRISTTFAPGVSWVGSESTATPHGVQSQYLTNSLTDNVQIWNCTTASGAIPTNGGAYPAGTLYKNVTIDEDGNQTVQYKDIEQKLILKQVELSSAGANHVGWLNTYYIYDDLNDLRYVLQPKFVDLMVQSGNWNLPNVSSLLTELSFYYEYDLRKRMVQRRVPGKAVEYFVYDSRDRQVMSQDGNRRQAGQWMVQVYDGFNRPVKTGLLNDGTTSFAIHTDNAATAAIQSDGSSYPSTTANFTLETQDFYDNYNWLASTPLSGGFDGSQSGTGFAAASDVSAPYPRAVAVTGYSTLGLHTGQMAAELGTPAQYSGRSLYTANYYDDRNRTLQSQSVNIAGGVDIKTSQYSFEGKELAQKMAHSKPGANSQSYTVQTSITYDEMGRLTGNSKTMSGSASTTVPNATGYFYDKLGRLMWKWLAVPAAYFGGADHLKYQYNIRGWIMAINPGQLTALSNTRAVIPNWGPASSGDQIYFSEEINYDKTSSQLAGNPYITPLFNGNISGITWGSAGDMVGRRYDMVMDRAGRLTSAVYNQQLPGGGWGGTGIDPNPTPDFRMNVAYDANGNLLVMSQYGWQATGSGPIDQLQYTYFDNTNRLKNVIEGTNNPNTLYGDFHYSPTYTASLGGPKPTSAVDYSYTPNGDLASDANKDITGITYNYLGLPQTITVANKGTINFVYDAAGNKLQKIVQEPNATINFFGNNLTTSVNTVTTYIDGKVYKSLSYSNPALSSQNYTDHAQYFLTDEGRFRFLYDPATNAMTGVASDFFEKDHIGNTRAVISDELGSTYYPPATLEGNINDPNTAVGFEQFLYNINSAFVTPANQVTGLPAYTNTNGQGSNYYPPGNSGLTNGGNNSQNVYRINGNQNKMGLGVAIKVMSGDVINIYGKAYYFNNNANDNNSFNLPASQVLTAFLSSPNLGVVVADHIGVANAGQILSRPQDATSIAGYLTNNYNPYSMTPGQRTATTSTTPRAYINWILLDNQFNFVNGGFAPVGAAGTITDFSSAPALHNISIYKSGFLYVYCSNESPVDVYFDNLQVVHTHGYFIEETHYYPFGLTMEGISDKAVKVAYADNLNRFGGKELQHQEFSDGSGLEQYDFGARFLDPQLGRWNSIDPLADKMRRFSPYNYGFDNPIRFLDPDGQGATDDYKLVKNGKIELIAKTSDKTDRIFATDAKGSVDKNKSITISKEVMASKGAVIGNKSTGSAGLTTYYTSSNTSEARHLFEFLATNSNVEFGLNLYTLKGKNKADIFTSNQDKKVGQAEMAARLKMIGGHPTEMDHSHPIIAIGSSVPSGFTPNGEVDPYFGGDRAVVPWVWKSFGNQVQFNMYTPPYYGVPQYYWGYDDKQLIRSRAQPTY